MTDPVAERRSSSTPPYPGAARAREAVPPIPASGRDRRVRAGLVAAGAAILLLLTACAAGPAEVSGAADAPGFFTGLWHGLILPVTFVVSLFNDEVGVYAVRNGGHLYDLGFVLGAGGLALPGVFARRSS